MSCLWRKNLLLRHVDLDTVTACKPAVEAKVLAPSPRLLIVNISRVLKIQDCYFLNNTALINEIVTALHGVDTHLSVLSFYQRIVKTTTNHQLLSHLQWQINLLLYHIFQKLFLLYAEMIFMHLLNSFSSFIDYLSAYLEVASM